MPTLGVRNLSGASTGLKTRHPTEGSTDDAIIVVDLAAGTKELLQEVLCELKMISLHLSQVTNEEFTIEDVEK